MKKVLFLDRDGIINIDHGYVYKKENFEFVDGIFEICRHALRLNYQIIVITNQAGIARGYYNEDDFLTLTTWMKTEFEKQQINILDVFFCPHHPTSGVNAYKKQCNCRKPAPGMILSAQKQYSIDLDKSIFIGDKISDMQAAINAGIKNRILVASQYVDEHDINAQKATTVLDALSFI
jgi:D-glycero-D-manno-heptose 1,7-bisphosphate phosphatase